MCVIFNVVGESGAIAQEAGMCMVGLSALRDGSGLT